MNGVYIKGLKMPEKCLDCKLCAFIPIGDDGLMTKCLPLNIAAEGEKLRPYCPLVSVETREDALKILDEVQDKMRWTDDEEG